MTLKKFSGFKIMVIIGKEKKIKFRKILGDKTVQDQYFLYIFTSPSCIQYTKDT